jgi:hypothetical protein
MEAIAGMLILFAVGCAIFNAAVKTLLGPIHDKLDRLIAIQEESRDIGKA